MRRRLSYQTCRYWKKSGRSGSIPYDRVMKTISGIMEVVYPNGSQSHVEYTKEQREVLEKLKIEL